MTEGAATSAAPRPVIAVATVCRNALDALRLTVQSVSSQRYAPVLHVVVDGASTDGTPEYLRAERHRFHAAVSEPDAGIYDAMNKAIDLCPQADWIVFLNAGDAFASTDVLDRALPMLRPDVDLVFGSVLIRNASGGARKVAARPRARTGMPGCHQATLVRGDVMRRLRFDASYRVGADFDFFLRATQEARRLAFLPDALAEVAPEGYSARNEQLLQEDYRRAIERHIGKPQAMWWLLRRKVRCMILRTIASSKRVAGT